MMHIGEHNHIVNLLGVCSDKQYKLRGILEYCPHGDLKKFLCSKRNLYQQTWEKTNHNEDDGFTLADQVTIAKDVAEGMQFLASKKVRKIFLHYSYQMPSSIIVRLFQLSIIINNLI